MKILFVTSVIPYPPNNGIRIVPYNALRLMANAGHQVCLCALSSEENAGPEGMTNDERFTQIKPMLDESSFWLELKKITYAGRVIRGIGIEPSFIKYYKNAEFARRLQIAISKFKPDAIHFDFINMCSYQRLAPEGVQTVASVNDSIALAMENRLRNKAYDNVLVKLAKHLQLFQIKTYEKKVYPRFDTVHLMTDVDASYLKKLNPAINTTVISNGVDDKLFDVPIASESKQKKVLFIGELKGNNLINIKRFVEQGWPLVLKHCPAATLDIVGAHTQASSQWASETLPKGIVFSGYVAELTDAYHDCSVAVVPIDKNSGIMNKAIEAMAAGVVPIGFHNGFSGVRGVQNGSEYLAGDNFAEIGELIASLLLDDNRRKEMADNARSAAQRSYSWNSKLPDFEGMYTHN